MLRAVIIIVGIILAAVGGVIAYRAFFLEPAAAVVISSEGVRELPNTARVVGGVALLIVGAAMAFVTALRKPRGSRQMSIRRSCERAQRFSVCRETRN